MSVSNNYNISEIHTSLHLKRKWLMTNISTLLTRGDKKVAIIGLGYLGYSCLIKMIRSGIQCYITDPKKERLNLFNKGLYPGKEKYIFWQNIKEIKHICTDDLFQTVSLEDAINSSVSVYVISVPIAYTHSDDNQFFRTLSFFQKVKDLYTNYEKPILIFENLLKPYTMDKIILPIFNTLGLKTDEDFILSYSPRKDWSLEDLLYKTSSKIVASTSEENREILTDFYKIFYNNVKYISCIKTLEVLTCFEYALDFVGNSLYSQILFAYPDINMSKHLDIVDNFYNGKIPGIHASLEEIIATHYLIDSSNNIEYLSILGNAVSANISIQMAIVEYIKNAKINKIAILGLLANENKPETISPSLILPQMLVNEGCEVFIHDPFIDSTFFNEQPRFQPIQFPKGLMTMEGIVILTPHICYSVVNKYDLVALLERCMIVLDNAGIWEKYDLDLDYKIIGSSSIIS